MSAQDKRAYTIKLTDVATGEDSLVAAIDLADDQRRDLVAYIVAVADATAAMGDALVEEAARESVQFNWNWPGRISAALSDGHVAMATKHYHSYAAVAPSEASQFVSELQSGEIDFAVLLTFKMAIARGPKR